MARPVRKFKVGRIYIFTWMDHMDHPETWSQLSDINMDEVTKITTIGKCIGSSNDYLTVAGTWEINSDDPVYSQVFKCLTSNIIESKEIKF